MTGVSGITRRRFLAGAGAAVGAGVAGTALSGCNGSAEGVFGVGDSGKILTIAIVSNSQMADAITMSYLFKRDHPGVQLKFVSLPENEARAKITADVSTNGGEFDVVMISNYETPMWSRYGWLTNLQPYINATPGYDDNDFIAALKSTLTYKGDMYSVPFYGESSVLMYRKDIFAKAGVKMPTHPSWDDVTKITEAMSSKLPVGICLRGDPGWGENLAPIDTVINAYGGRWFDLAWNAELTSPQSTAAITTYMDLIRRYGEPGASADGFAECASLYGQGDALMWYDATSAVSTIEDPSSSTVVGKNGYVWAPTQDGRPSGWLYTWSLSIPTTCPDKQLAWDFIAWMTSKSYIKTVGATLGWTHVPPGSRYSSYQIPEYKALSKNYGAITLASIAATDSNHPCLQPVPYTGVQFLDIPEFQDLGTNVSEQFSACVAGSTSVGAALSQSQEYAQAVGVTYK